MNLVTAKKLNQVYAYQKDIALIFGYKHPQRLLKAFRDICDERPSYDADAVQKEVNRILNNVEAKKSNEEVAKEVVKGEWGNNPTRSKNLIEAGYDVNAIQKLVNDILNQPEDTEAVDVVEVEPSDNDRLNLKPNEFEIDGRVYEVKRK